MLTLLFRDVWKQVDLNWKQVEIISLHEQVFHLFWKKRFLRALYWTDWRAEMKEYVRYTFLAVSQRSDFDKFRELMHLILAAFQHLKWLWLAQWGTLATSSKQEVIFVSDWPRRGGGDVFTSAWFLLELFSSSFTTAAHPASPKYLQNGINLCCGIKCERMLTKSICMTLACWCHLGMVHYELQGRRGWFLCFVLKGRNVIAAFLSHKGKKRSFSREM